MVDNEVMTAKDVAIYLKLKERTVNNLAMKGKIPAVKIGRQWRFLPGRNTQRRQDKGAAYGQFPPVSIHVRDSRFVAA